MIGFGVTAFVLAGCSSSGDDTAGDTPRETDTPAATATPRATDTPAPPTSTPTPRPTATPTPDTRPKLGTTIEAKGSKYTVNEVRDNLPATRFSAPKEGMRWVAVDITQEGVTAGDSFNSFYIFIQDTKAFRYQSAFVIGAPEPSFTSGTLTAGQKVRGWVSYEIPADAVIEAVLVQPDPLGGTIPAAVLIP